ncbi:glycoside hydrolase family 2 TIM barrel-domain containing protein [Paenibacillus thalictri]|nr:glycoside hydrolase family 2 TIM barrel-domain containing protein [Paenibacillus thalictri]
MAPEPAMAATDPEYVNGGSSSGNGIAADLPVPTQVQYLSGTDKDHTVNWDFKVTAGSKSELGWTTLPVPSMWDVLGFGTLGYGFNTSNEQGLYKYNFNVPASWSGQKVSIVFEGSMTDTDVYINGKSAGPVHQGAFYRFKYDISDKLNYGASLNTLEATVSKMSDNASVNRAERQGDYWIFGGIFRPVYLEMTPSQSIERTAINAKADGSFAMDVYVNGIVDADNLVAQIKTLDGQNVGAPFTAGLGQGVTSRRLKTTVASPQLWTAETPNLYKVEISMQKQGQTIHTVTERFGFRTIEARAGDGIYVNGKKIILKGANRHAFWPDSGRTLSPEIDRNDIMLMKQMNMNAVRMSHYPPDQSFLALCDELGLYVIDELAGWQKAYDTTVGTKLATEMITRDVNHPSIVFWANGNEFGWNTDLDPLFYKSTDAAKSLDPQMRPVLHTKSLYEKIDASHYLNYTDTKNKIETQPNIFMPTEFLHSLFDGGAGAGLNDYWKLMGDITKPKSAGGFIWALLDEGVKRPNGTIDANGDNYPDGIVGPYRQKEGSYFTIKDIFSPVQLTDADNLEKSFPTGFTGDISISNQYQFTNLNQLKYTWQLLKMKNPTDTGSGYVQKVTGQAVAPNIAPGAAGLLRLNLPDGWKKNADYDALSVTVQDSAGTELATWTWMIKKAADFRSGLVDAGVGTVTALQDDAEIMIASAATVLKFDKTSGTLKNITQNGKPVSFNNGPVLASGTQTFKDISVSSSGSDQVVLINYTGDMKFAKWTLHPSGWVDLEYKYNLNGDYDYMGVNFSYPKDKVTGVKWLGKGPYRVYKNRMRGPVFNVWEKALSESTNRWDYPEFAGFYRDTYWAVLKTTQGDITMSSKDENLFLRLYNIDFSYDNASPGKAYTPLPSGDISFLDGIPAIGDKFDMADAKGPEGQKNKASGDYARTISFKFDMTNSPGETPEDINLALNKLKSFSTQENEAGSAARNAVDGVAATKWASAGATSDFPQWIELDLQAVSTIKRIELLPQDSRAYRYKVEAKQKEGDSYTTILDRTQNQTSAATLADDLSAPVKARYVKLTITGIYNSTTKFASIYEFRVIGPKVIMPDQPADLKVTGSTPDTIDLSWSSVNGAESYNVYRSTSLRDTFVKVNASPLTATSFRDSGLNGRKYIYKVTAVNSAGTQSAPSDAVPAAAELYGPAKALAGQPFDLTWAVLGVTQSVYQQVYGHSLTLQFDPAKLNMISASSLNESKLKVTENKVLAPGKISLKTTTPAGDSTFGANGDVLKLTFKSSAVSQETKSQVLLSNVQLNSPAGVYEVSGLQYEVTLQPAPLDKSALNETIASAQNKLSLAVEGAGNLQYPTGSKAVLQAAVDEALRIANMAEIFQQDVDQAKVKLAAALAEFDSKVIRIFTDSSSSNPSGGSTPGGGTSSGPTGGGATTSPGSATESNGNNGANRSVVSISPQVKLDQASGAAVSKIDAGAWDKALAEASASGNAVNAVVIQIQQIPGVQSYVTQIPSQAINGTTQNVQFKLATPLATVTSTGNLFKTGELADKEVEFHVRQVDSSKWDESLQRQVGSRPVIDLSIQAGGNVIPWSNSDAPVSISIPYTPTPAELTDSENIVIWYVDGQGQATPVSNGKYDSSTGTVTFTVTHFSTYAVGFVKKTFQDIASLDWARKPIEVLASKGIVQGASESAFNPSEQVSRADFLVLLVRTLELKGALGSPFADVKADAYYAEALQLARGLGIAEGGEGNLFRPQDPITRQDMMVLTDRALKSAKKASPQAAGAPIDAFQDASDVSAYAASSVNALVSMGLVHGFNQSIYPQNTTNRAQAAVLMYNIYNLSN